MAKRRPRKKKKRDDDKDNYYLAGLALLLIAMFFVASPTVPSQTIVPIGNVVGFEGGGEPIGLPENPSAVAFQSIAFSAGRFSADLVSFEEGIGPLMKTWHGLYVWMWVALAGIAAVNVALSFVEFKVRDIPERNESMNLINMLYLLLPLFSYLGLGILLVGYDQAAVFYLIFLAIPIGFLAFMRRYNIDLRIAVNDKALMFVDITGSTQFLLGVASVIGMFFFMSVSQVNYAAFSTSGGGQLSRLVVVAPEDLALNYVPSMVLLLVGNVLILIGIALLYGKETYQILQLRTKHILGLINDHKRMYFSCNVILVLLIAVFMGYVGANYHVRAYTQLAPLVADNMCHSRGGAWDYASGECMVNGFVDSSITEEIAYGVIIESVSSFWSYGSVSITTTGMVLPTDFVHGCINLMADV